MVVWGWGFLNWGRKRRFDPRIRRKKRRKRLHLRQTKRKILAGNPDLRNTMKRAEHRHCICRTRRHLRV